MNKGIFITFEGIEGSGKSTQVKLLNQVLNANGIPTLMTREPGGPPISEAIRNILLKIEHSEMLPETELLLYMASRSQHTGQWILPALNRGKVVICDRYNDSTIAYQGAARDMNQAFIQSLANFATFHTSPDLTFLIDLTVAEGLSRIADRKLDRLELETITFHEKVREQYLAIAKNNPLRYIVLNGSDNPDNIHQQVLSKVFSLIGVKQ
ncbi:MAG: dTMP kinase [Candidatus Cloacimonetes bacterium HGW-Cloacimonetes-1]|jgi:dTMP kinase|nr:MAG: dTMP kinase [Candidatus Cloacimonetes bacterium HGW-Cloacimonetes-1]